MCLCVCVCARPPDSAGGLGGYEILKLHDADPLLAVELKFVGRAACGRVLQSYGSGTLRQALAQHAGRLLAAGPELQVGTLLKAGTHTLDLCLDSLEACLDHIHLSQVGGCPSHRQGADGCCCPSHR